MTRQPRTIIAGKPASDGAGVRLLRSLGTPALPRLDPFLMLDEFRSDDASDYIAGFPPHPHRGFETVTYMLAGAMRHEDSMGNKGDLGPGSVQWMTAGRGIVHSEMPRQDNGLMWGFQLWVNLPASLKMTAPRYQDIPPDAVVEVEVGDARVRVLAGTFAGVTGPVQGIATRPLMLDAALQGGAPLVVHVPPDHNVFAYVFAGTAAFGDEAPVARGHLVAFGPGDRVEARGEGRFLLLAGQPINEPVARYGPFVMNTRAELARAFDDYQAGRLGS